MVFAPGTRQPRATQTNLELSPSGAKVFENGAYFIANGTGREHLKVEGIPAPVRLDIHWRLTCGDRKLTLDDLRSWTEIPEIRYFSGRGVYEGNFEYSPTRDLGVVLDLGQVRETADVRINGKPAGVAWMRPYRLDISNLLQAGRNTIRVDVTNLLINKVLGDGPIDYSAVFAKYGPRFPAGEEWDVIREPFPSGLLGPLRLRFYKNLRV